MERVSENTSPNEFVMLGTSHCVCRPIGEGKALGNGSLSMSPPRPPLAGVVVGMNQMGEIPRLQPGAPTWPSGTGLGIRSVESINTAIELELRTQSSKRGFGLLGGLVT
jgi:hypothetical protein